MRTDMHEMQQVMELLTKTIARNAERGLNTEMDCIVMSSDRMKALMLCPKDALDRLAVIENGVIKKIFDVPVLIDNSVDLAIDFDYIAPSDPDKRTVTIRSKGEEENDFRLVDVLRKNTS